MVYIIVTRTAMFMIYLKWQQNQEALGTFMNNNYKNVIKSKGDTEFKTEQTKNAKHRKTKN